MLGNHDNRIGKLEDMVGEFNAKLQALEKEMKNTVPKTIVQAPVDIPKGDIDTNAVL